MAPRSGDTTASVMRRLTNDHHAKVVSRISALTATFHISRGPGDSRTQTGRSRAQCERQPNLWKDSPPQSPGQLGSIQSLNGDGAGDDFSLAGRERFEPWDDLCYTTKIARFINCLAQKGRCPDRVSAENLHAQS